MTVQRGCIGVIGGMGPVATADMLAKIVRHTPARRDEDHLRVVVDCNPGIPSPTKYLLGRGPSPIAALVTSARFLAGAGAQVLVMACNTAHVFYDEVAAAVPIPVVHIMRAVARWLRTEHPAIRRVGLLASTPTVEAGIYQKELNQAGISVLVPPPSLQGLVMRAIMEPEGVKANHLEGPRSWLREVARDLERRGCAAIIGGCTEVPVALRQGDLQSLFVDATEIAAMTAVRTATNEGGGGLCATDRCWT